MIVYETDLVEIERSENSRMYAISGTYPMTSKQKKKNIILSEFIDDCIRARQSENNIDSICDIDIDYFDNTYTYSIWNEEDRNVNDELMDKNIKIIEFCEGGFGNIFIRVDII